MLTLEKSVAEALDLGADIAKQMRHKLLTPEHLLKALLKNDTFITAIKEASGNVEAIKIQINDYLEHEVIKETTISGKLDDSEQFANMLRGAAERCAFDRRNEINIVDVLNSLFALDQSSAAYILGNNVDPNKLLYILSQGGTTSDDEDDFFEEDEDVPPPMGMPFPFMPMGAPKKQKGAWKKMVTNINEEVKDNPTPFIGREAEIERTVQIACRKTKNNPVHVGEAGVGKTAIIRGLAERINNDDVPEKLKGHTVYELNMASLTAGTQYRGQFEEKLEDLLKDMEKEGKCILYIDEIHTIVGAGAGGSGALDAANILKPYLTRGKIKFIGATTHDEYKKFIEKDKALDRRFQPVSIEEPSEEDAIEILKGLKEYYEKYHGVTYTDEALEAAVRLSAKYINDRFLPDKAIDIIDEAGSVLAIKGCETTVVDKAVIEKVLGKIAKIPTETVSTDDKTKLLMLGDNLKSKVYGQDQAVEALVRSIKRHRAGFGESNKPIASLLFVGPTGTGKTYIAQNLANEMGIPLIKYDMSEYMEAHSVAKLIGAPAGYVGYENGGKLIDDIKKNPHCVLLLDEIEKAHPDVFNALLQIMDDAVITDSQGRKADFKNVILIMTSNAGAKNIGKKSIGFGEMSVNESNKDVLDEAVKRTFSPEFRNRLTKVVAFNGIDRTIAESIVYSQLERVSENLKKQNVTADFKKSCVDYILKKGFSEEFGAREIKRVIANEIEDLFVDEILEGKLENGGNCYIETVDDKLILSVID